MDTSSDSTKMVFHADTNTSWFQPNHMVNGVAVHRDRAMYTANIEVDPQTGDLIVF